MKYLHDSGFTTISLDQLYDAYQGKAVLPEKPIVLTFDDGYPDNYTVAFPVLKQNNFKATFFVSTGAVGPGMMTWDQLKEMQEYGMSIESHTVNHFDLRTLAPAQQRKELAGSKQAIESKLGTKVKFFCYPSGKYNDVTLKILNEFGYKLAVTTVYGNAKLGDPLLQLKRIRINGGSNLATFKRQVSG